MPMSYERERFGFARPRKSWRHRSPVFPLNSKFPPRTRTKAETEGGRGRDHDALARRRHRRHNRRRTRGRRRRWKAWCADARGRIFCVRSEERGEEISSSSVLGEFSYRSSGGDANSAPSVTPIAPRLIRSAIKSAKKGLADRALLNRCTTRPQ